MGQIVRRLLRIGVLIAAVVAVAATPQSTADTGAARRSFWTDFLKRWLFRGAVLGAAGGTVALLLVVSGVVPIGASAGHWSVTEAFLQFAKRRSVATHSFAIDVPSLDDPRLVTIGGGHYDFGCRPCHGSPSLDRPAIARHMLPRPPVLRQSVVRYEPQELFYIVKHGIKLTGMPAWPALQREDEVWAMVAFLRRLPALDAATYQQITGSAGGANGPMPIERLEITGEPPDLVAESCRRCHGMDGLGRGGAFPRLAGQRPEYLLASLRAYARGERHSGIMQPVASSLQRDAMVRMAAYYAAQPIPYTASAEADNTRSAAGKRIAHEGIPSQLVPACIKCHGPGSHPRNPHYPVLAGQYAEYLVQQLSLFKTGDRGGTPYEHIMRKVARQLTADQIGAVAEYYASLPPEPAGR